MTGARNNRQAQNLPSDASTSLANSYSLNPSRPVAFLVALLALVVTADAASWQSMDYRATGFTYQSLTWPNSNTDYSLLWRASRQARAEAKGFVEQTHYLGGSHQSNSIFGPVLPDHVLTNGHYYLDDMYWPGISVTQAFTNLVYVWSNYAGTTTDGLYVYPTNGVPRWRQNDGTTPTVGDSGGSDYGEGDTVALNAGDALTQAVYRIESAPGGVVASVSILGLTGGPERGNYVQLPGGVFDTVALTGGGSGLRLNIEGCWDQFSVSGVFVGLTEGQPICLSNNLTGGVWTNEVETLEASSMWFEGNEAVPFTSTNCTLFTLSHISTNLNRHPTWTNCVPLPLDCVYSWTPMTTNEQTLIIGPNGLKMWMKSCTWQMETYGLVEYQHAGPNVDVLHWKPPMTQVFAVVVTPIAGEKIFCGSSWTNSNRMVTLPAAMTTYGWPFNADGVPEFSVRQWWGQPAAGVFKYGAPYHMFATGGVQVLVIGR